MFGKQAWRKQACWKSLNKIQDIKGETILCSVHFLHHNYLSYLLALETPILISKGQFSKSLCGQMKKLSVGNWPEESSARRQGHPEPVAHVKCTANLSSTWRTPTCPTEMGHWVPVELTVKLSSCVQIHMNYLKVQLRGLCGYNPH